MQSLQFRNYICSLFWGQVVKRFYQDANIGQNVEVLFKGASITPQPQYTPSFENYWNKTDPNEVSLHSAH